MIKTPANAANAPRAKGIADAVESPVLGTLSSKAVASSLIVVVSAPAPSVIPSARGVVLSVIVTVAAESEVESELPEPEPLEPELLPLFATDFSN